MKVINQVIKRQDNKTEKMKNRKEWKETKFS